MAEDILRVENVSKSFGGVKALNNCSLNVKRGECLAIIGPNGSGKTTFLNVINGFIKADNGRVYFKNIPIDGEPPNKICRLGVGRVFQVTKLFNNMTVLENILIKSVWLRQDLKELKEKALNLLREFGIPEPLTNQLVSKLSGGQQKLIDIARALMSDPELLLLDEPLAGVHVTIKERIINIVKQLVDEGKTVLFVSHDIPSVIRVASEVVFMDSGMIVVRGEPREVLKHKAVVAAYMGV